MESNPFLEEFDEMCELTKQLEVWLIELAKENPSKSACVVAACFGAASHIMVMEAREHFEGSAESVSRSFRVFSEAAIANMEKAMKEARH